MSNPRYPKAVVIIHWLTTGLILLGLTLIFIRDLIEGKPARLWMLSIHKFIGLLVPALLMLRVLFVIKYRKHFPDHELDLFSKVAAKTVHFALYLSLLVIPLLGWAQVSAKGQPVNFLGFIHLPALVSEDMDMAETLADWHEWAAYILLALIFMHALAALWHHYFKKDNVLRAMAPIFK
ncbi:cytochrome b [Methylotenera sp. G11]|uniref:cytochrome b n=1 Tax=Methylotenera sp. G11 TaxID=1506585 RepID=UPI000646FDDE|nr:cytochrome b [Methylotenera sp. G11]